MTFLDIEVDLSDEAQTIRDTVHKFAEEVMRPAGEALDKLQDPADVSAEGSILWDVYEKYHQIGIDDMEADGGGLEPTEAAKLRAIINEELGWGDSGIAVSFGAAGMHRIFANMSGQPALIERFCNEGAKEIGCWAITEPDHGSDSLGFNQPHFSDPGVRANCIAHRDGNEFVIRGQKAAWVSNGSIADVATLFCTIDGDQGFKGGGVALVPLDLPGVSRGKPLDKLGQRSLNQGELFFDDVRIPAEYMV
ncbi:MAG: acyl-CoA/acyl-ACP dehydrogenase, partial [Deltaproteobacteria bacterium]|nr:acyl-CoA/acyl-ACP dehydrogenase [Deltaproteobacteria bacterium]